MVLRQSGKVIISVILFFQSNWMKIMLLIMNYLRRQIIYLIILIKLWLRKNEIIMDKELIQLIGIRL